MYPPVAMRYSRYALGLQPNLCAVTPVALVCSKRLGFPQAPFRPSGSLYLFSSAQINCLHLIKDASRRLSSNSLLSPAFSPFPLSVFPFLYSLSLCFHPSVNVVYPISCTEPLNLSALCKNKTSSLLCKLYLLILSFLFFSFFFFSFLFIFKRL